MMIVVKEASADWTTSNGAVATLLNEPKVSLLIEEEEAIADDEWINYRVVDEAVVSINDDDDIRY